MGIERLKPVIKGMCRAIIQPATIDDSMLAVLPNGARPDIALVDATATMFPLCAVAESIENLRTGHIEAARDADYYQAQRILMCFDHGAPRCKGVEQARRGAPRRKVAEKPMLFPSVVGWPNHAAFLEQLGGRTWSQWFSRAMHDGDKAYKFDIHAMRSAWLLQGARERAPDAAPLVLHGVIPAFYEAEGEADAGAEAGAVRSPFGFGPSVKRLPMRARIEGRFDEQPRDAYVAAEDGEGEAIAVDTLADMMRSDTPPANALVCTTDTDAAVRVLLALAAAKRRGHTGTQVYIDFGRDRAADCVDGLYNMNALMQFIEEDAHPDVPLPVETFCLLAIMTGSDYTFGGAGGTLELLWAAVPKLPLGAPLVEMRDGECVPNAVAMRRLLIATRTGSVATVVKGTPDPWMYSLQTCLDPESLLEDAALMLAAGGGRTKRARKDAPTLEVGAVMTGASDTMVSVESSDVAPDVSRAAWTFLYFGDGRHRVVNDCMTQTEDGRSKWGFIEVEEGEKKVVRLASHVVRIQ